MTPEQVLVVIEEYRCALGRLSIAAESYPHDEIVSDFRHGLEHCHSMLDQMVRFVADGKMDKVFRWLGFVQGVLWMAKMYTLNELKEHNR